jgi:hypothetical protein
MLVLLMGRIYELRHSVWLRGLDIGTKFLKDFSAIENVVRGDTHTQTHSKANSQVYFHFFKIREVQ